MAHRLSGGRRADPLPPRLPPPPATRRPQTSGATQRCLNPGFSERIGNSRRTGELDISFSRARFTDVDPAGDRIPGALDRVISGAVTVEPARRVFGSVRLRHFGPRPLVEDGTVSSKSTTIWNGEIGVNLTNQLRLTIEGFNLFDSDVADIDYFYTSRLPGEPLEGVGRHPHAPLDSKDRTRGAPGHFLGRTRWMAQSS